jgi:hypothetical protein
MPPLIFGPPLQSVENVTKLNFSTKQIHSIINSAKTDSKTVPKTAFPGFVSTGTNDNSEDDVLTIA